MNPYAGRRWCHECHPDHPTRPCWRHGDRFLCRSHFAAVTGAPPPKPRTAENIDHEQVCQCAACVDHGDAE